MSMSPTKYVHIFATEAIATCELKKTPSIVRRPPFINEHKYS